VRGVFWVLGCVASVILTVACGDAAHPDAAELSIHVRHGQRSRAIAARIERIEGRWRCSVLDFG